MKLPDRLQLRRLLFCLGLMVVASNDCFSQDWQPLWSNGAPGSKGSAEQDVPALQHSPAPAAKANGCAVVVCPGGGYGGLAMDHEGKQIAAWLNERGIGAWILRYRLGTHGYHHPIQKGDVLRAIRTVRFKSKELGYDPSRIGVWGFSAGGHLASTAATHFDNGNTAATDPIDQVSSRPDFAILGYPVITMAEDFTHKGSRKNLLGEERYDNQELVELLSNEKRVTQQTPPSFIFHTVEDKAVPVENALKFFAALRANGVNASEMHVYQNGRHGVGLAQDDPILSSWPSRLHDWLKLNKFAK
jgi:acetyl esterase/lipase